MYFFTLAIEWAISQGRTERGKQGGNHPLTYDLLQNSEQKFG